LDTKEHACPQLQVYQSEHNHFHLRIAIYWFLGKWYFLEMDRDDIPIVYCPFCGVRLSEAETHEDPRQ
jgi:glutaminase